MSSTARSCCSRSQVVFTLALEVFLNTCFHFGSFNQDGSIFKLFLLSCCWHTKQKEHDYKPLQKAEQCPKVLIMVISNINLSDIKVISIKKMPFRNIVQLWWCREDCLLTLVYSTILLPILAPQIHKHIHQLLKEFLHGWLVDLGSPCRLNLFYTLLL